MIMTPVHEKQYLLRFSRIQALKCNLATGGAPLSIYFGPINIWIFGNFGGWSSTGVAVVLPRSPKVPDSDSTGNFGYMVN